MPVEEIAERVKLQGINVSDFINPSFLKKIKSKKWDIKPVAVVLIAKEKKEKKPVVFPIFLEHSNEKEVSEKILHFTCKDEKLFEKIKKIIKSE